MGQNTARVVDLAAFRTERAQLQRQPVAWPMVLVWMPVWFLVPVAQG